MSESFTFDVSYSTSFEELEKLRVKMLEFVKSERRDFQPVFDVTVKGMLNPYTVRKSLNLLYVIDFPEQTKMTLSADIKYKSNAQHAPLRGRNTHNINLLLAHILFTAAKRRNKWICALKTSLAELKIYGPTGDPDAPAAVNRYTKVPWDIIEREDLKTKEKKEAALSRREKEEEERRKTGEEWKLGDKNAILCMSPMRHTTDDHRFC